jgi:hypothetical protein
MYRRTSPQRGLFEKDFLLDERTRAALRESWAEGFQAHVLPVLLRGEDEIGARLYHETAGRPTWSVARMLGLTLLRELMGLRSDQATVEALWFDARWKHALGFAMEESTYLTRRSLVDFRTRMYQRDPEGLLLKAVFERVGKAAIDDLGLSTKTQRVDSTFVTSNMRELGRLTLLRETLRVFVEAMKKAGLDSELPAAAREQVEEEDGWGARSRLPYNEQALDLGALLSALVERFQNDPTVRDMPELEHLARVLREHFALVPVAAESTESTESTETSRDAASVETSRDAAPGVGPSTDTVARAAPTDAETTSSADSKDNASATTEPANDATAPSGTADSVTPKEEASETSTDASVEAVDAEGDTSTPPKKKPVSAKTARKNRRAETLARRRVMIGSEEHEIRFQGQSAADSLQSPHDLDARRGHKGIGYLVEVTETACNDVAEIITQATIRPGNVPDKVQGADIIQGLQASGHAPETLLADAGYATSEAFEAASKHDVDLISPAQRTGVPATSLSREHFVFDEDGFVTSCPQGQAPLRHADRGTDDGRRALHVIMDVEKCCACAERARCPISIKKQAGKRPDAIMDVSIGMRGRDRAWMRMNDPSSPARQSYSMRSGVEATQSELKRAHGLDRLTVRGLARCRTVMYAKVTACNIKRWMRARMEASSALATATA